MNIWQQGAGILAIVIILAFIVFFLIYLWKCTHD